MRAIFLKEEMDNIKIGDPFIYEGDETHHLINVVRIQIGEEVLILNGVGKKITTVVEDIKKKKILFNIINIEVIPQKKGLSLALATPKKEAFLEILRLSTEIGLENIFPFQTKYSQPLKLNDSKIEKVISSAVIQSNNVWAPVVNPTTKFEKLEEVLKGFKNIFLFSPNAAQTLNQFNLDNSLMIIGPEGGFSSSEIGFFKEHQVVEVGLPTPILRAPTAVCVAAGFLFGKGF